MKGINKILVLSSLVLGGLALGLSNQQPSMVEYTHDVNNESVQLNVRNNQIGNEATVDVSRTFVQYGIRENNNYVLRFATAVKGSIDQITYTRTAEGREDNIKNVTHVYQGLLSGEATVYYNPVTQDVTTDEAYKGMYYWACYTIEYTSEEAKDLEVSVSATVVDSENNEVVSTPRATSLSTLLEANKKEYSIAGEVLEDTYIYSSEKDTDHSTKTTMGLKSKNYRVYFKVDFSDILNHEDFEANKDAGRFVLNLAITKGESDVDSATFTFAGSPVKYDNDKYTAAIPFSNVTWNTAQQIGKYIYSSLQSNTIETIFDADTVKVSKNLAHPDGYLQIKLTYEQVKNYICMDAGDYYGQAVFQLRSNTSINIASLENTSYATPSFSYVYEK